MTARFLVGDVFDRLAELETGSVDLVITSPPFLALRSYLPADHPDKSKEIGSESTPAAFLDVMLRVMGELRRVTAGHGSVCIELGDTYAGSGGGGGDYYEGGLKEGQPGFTGSSQVDRDALREANAAHWRQKNEWKKGGLANYNDQRGNPDGMRDPTFSGANTRTGGGGGWPLAKSRALIPELFRVALAYGINPLTGQPSPAGKWLVRNVVTWCRPNPPVGALGDKWRPATSDVVVACTSPKRYWDDLATRRPHQHEYRQESGRLDGDKRGDKTDGQWSTLGDWNPSTSAGGPLLDYWEIPPTGYSGSHYAVYPPALVEPLVKAMCPSKVCRTCGQPTRRIVDVSYEAHGDPEQQNSEAWAQGEQGQYGGAQAMKLGRATKISETTGWSDCGHDNWRPGLILDPFAGSGTTLLVATGHGHDAIGIDLDERNAKLALERVGPFLLEVVA